jgi:hypothetical protein
MRRALLYRTALAAFALMGFLASQPCPGAAQCMFAYDFNEGSGSMNNSYAQTDFSVGGSPAGISSNAQFTNIFGFRTVAQSNYQNCFLVTGHPLAVQVAPGSPSGSQLVLSPNGTMTLAWTDGTNGAPVQYRVYFGPDASTLPLVSTVTLTSYDLNGLAYANNYYWKIDTFDAYGRDTWSVATFSFSIAPSLDHLYCAPNPFRAGFQPTTCIFSMPGSGWAGLKIYALPHADLVFGKRLDGLTSGTNTFLYDGRDGDGRTLFNGVYTAILEKHGAYGNATERFRFIVAK